MNGLKLATMMISHSDIVGNKKKYFNYPVAFDIETTSLEGLNEYTGEVEKMACMCCWSMYVGDAPLFGRTWEEFEEVLDALEELGEEYKAITVIYVHNLSYEFQFMYKRYRFYDVFALDNHKPIRARLGDWIEFRCSYALSGAPLAYVGDNLKTPLPKLRGDWDYNLRRGSATLLTPEEIEYSMRDSLIVSRYIAEKLQDGVRINEIPMTKTGYVRRECRDEMKKDPKQWKRTKSIGLTVDDYIQLKETYQGGFTHANWRHVGKVMRDVISFDFTSSYPYCMVAKYVPASFVRYDVKNKADLEKHLSKYCCMFRVKLVNVRSKGPEDIISESKCFHLESPNINNGRVHSADVLCTAVTELDWEMIKRFYEFDAFYIKDFKIASRMRLPTPIVKTILRHYVDKTKLKGTTDDLEKMTYALAKEFINSIYGCMVTDINRQEWGFDNLGNWAPIIGDIDTNIEKYNKDYSRFLAYQWGVWITAHARYNLFTGILECGDDYIYSDTDSIKLINYEKHKAYFENYNEEVEGELLKACAYHNIPYEQTHPLNRKGVACWLGKWDFDGQYNLFKTLGAKRYAYVENDVLHTTVAGCSKEQLANYLIDKAGPLSTWTEVLKQFHADIFVPPENSGRKTHIYIDTPQRGHFTDWRGEVQEFFRILEHSLDPITIYYGDKLRISSFYGGPEWQRIL